MFRALFSRAPRSAGPIAWEQVLAIDIVTTDDGPFSEDVFWILKTPDHTYRLPGSSGEQVLDQAHRFPGLSYEAVISAMGSVESRTFEVWRKTGT